MAGEPCDQCDGAGIWAGGCEQVIDCWQCHGTGVQRVRGNCDACLGWGWAYGAVPCTACHETGWIAEAVALYRCADCSRTIRAADVDPECSINATHRLSRVSAPTDQRPR